MKTLLIFIALVSAGAAAAKQKEPRLPDPANDKVLVLEPLKVEGQPLISYAIDITIYADPKTKKVNRIFIARVLPHTDAEQAGLQRGDEIVKIGGIAVTELDSRVAPDSALGRIFLNRDPGEPLDLEVLVRRPERFTLRAQRGSLPDQLR